MQEPKHVGFVNYHGSLMSVLVSDEMPVPYKYMLVVTSKEYERLQSSISPVPPVAGIEAVGETSSVPVVLEKTDRFPPMANEWISLAPGAEVMFGCPRCGAVHRIKTPDFQIGEDGTVSPDCRCTKCGMHRTLKLGASKPPSNAN